MSIHAGVEKIAEQSGVLLFAFAVFALNATHEMKRSSLVECGRFSGDEASYVAVHQAPVKTAARMRVKAAEYAPPHPKGHWPLSANILDPVLLAACLCCPDDSRLA